MPPRRDPAANALSASSSAGAVAGGATGANGLGVLTKKTFEELENKRDAFVEAMNTLSYAAKTAARTGYDYFNILASASGLPPSSLLPPDLTSTSAHANGFIPINYNAHVRAASTAPGEPWGRIQTLLPASVEEGAEDAAEDTGKNKRKRGPKRKEKKDADPDAPKKPISAYFQFTAAARPIIRKDMGGTIPAKDVITEAASRWQALPADEKNAWLTEHHKQMIQWYIDTNAYRASKGLPLEPVPKDYQPGATPINLLPAALEEEEEEEDEEEETTTPDEADEDEDEDDDENPATPPPPPAKKARGAPRRAANGNDAVTSVVTAPVPRKRGRPAKNPNAHANANSTPSTIAPAPSTPTTAPEVSTPDTSKRKRAPSIKAKEAKELAAAKAPTRSPSKNTSTPITTPTTTAATAAATTPTTAAATTAGVDAAEKQVQEEAEGSITVASSGGGGGGGGLRVKVVETPGSMREKKERKKRKAKGEE